jgi:hypothetical protein
MTASYKFRKGTLMGLGRLLPLFVVFLLVSCFSAQAEGPVHGPQAGSLIPARRHRERTPATCKNYHRSANEPEHCQSVRQKIDLEVGRIAVT